MLSVTSSLTRLTTSFHLHYPNPNSNLVAPIPKSNHLALPIRSRSIRSAGNGFELSPAPNDFPAISVPKRVVLVRHGQSTWNAEGRIQGSSNFSVLTEKGENQAEVLRQMLVGDQFDVCFASPLNRSKRTAEIIWGSRKEKMITDYELREIDLYSFQGLLKHEGKSKFGDAYSQWQMDASNFNIDGHYPVRELWSRARNCWKKVLAHDSSSVLVVAHNAVNQALIGTALGLGPEYFRVLVQSNCGVSALDFSPSSEGSPPYVCLNQLNQTPKSPVAESGGRKASKRMILVCTGSCSSNNEEKIHIVFCLTCGGYQVKGIYTNHPEEKTLNAELSQKVAELLSDLKVTSIISSPGTVCTEAATVVSNVQKASHAGTSKLVMKQIKDLDAENIAKQSIQLGQRWYAKFNSETVTKLWDQSGPAWRYLLSELSDESQPENVVVAVAPPPSHVALLGRCLSLTKEPLSLFHLDSGSVTVIDFPDGPAKQGIVKCTNYTAHLGKWAAPISKSSLPGVEF